MPKKNKLLVALTGAAVLMTGQLMTLSTAHAQGADAAAEGKKIAFSRKLGNCLACHMMDDGVSPGNTAPPLIAMKARYPDKAKLRSQIWDPLAANPDSFMPPFGRHQILTDDQIDLVVEYIWTL